MLLGQSVRDAPWVLIVHTNRQDNDYNSLSHNIKFESKFRLNEIEYELMGLVCFEGQGLRNGGHYTAKVRDDETWYFCSDMDVEEIEEMQYEGSD